MFVILGYIVVVALTVHFKPDLAPPTAKTTGREKWAALGGVWPIALVFAVVFVVTIALTVYTMAKSKRLSDFLDVLSEERVGPWAKLKAFAAIWSRDRDRD